MNTPVLIYDLDATRKIVLARLRDYRARVYLFGSQATGKARVYSDIDVAVLPLQKLPISLFSEIHEELEESDIVRTVDVVDLTEADESFRQRVEREGIIWKE
jgi:predicted nucleotidyltransferase